jgi:hypothetical protein
MLLTGEPNLRLLLFGIQLIHVQVVVTGIPGCESISSDRAACNAACSSIINSSCCSDPQIDQLQLLGLPIYEIIVRSSTQSK